MRTTTRKLTTKQLKSRLKMRYCWLVNSGEFILSETGEELPKLPDDIRDCPIIMKGIYWNWNRLYSKTKPQYNVETMRIVKDDFIDECVQEIAVSYNAAIKGQGRFLSLWEGCGRVSGRFVKQYGSRRKEAPDSIPADMKKEIDFSRFTPRQQQILRYLVAGYNQQEAGERLGLSDSTISRELELCRSK